MRKSLVRRRLRLQPRARGRHAGCTRVRRAKPPGESEMTVPDLAEPARAAIVDRWLELTLEVYPEDSARFMKREKDRFGNPVGQLTRESLASLFEALLNDRTPEEMRDSLDPLVHRTQLASGAGLLARYYR